MFRPVNYEGRLKSELKCTEDSGISAENKEIIFDFYEYFRLQGISPGRLNRELQSLRHICQRFEGVLNGKSLKELDDRSARKLAIEIETFQSDRYKDGVATKNEYKKALRRLNRWLGKEELNQYFKVRDKTDNELTADDLITADDFLKMLKACRHVRDSALIAMHYDLGCRPEEILSLQLKHVKKDDMGIKVNLHRSKTFTRSPRLTFSIPYVLEWMEGNPARDDPDAPFWINLNTHRSGGIKPDVHVIRVFKRLGLISEKDEELALKSARRLNPEYPGALDGPVWYIGKHICTQTPRCGSCPMEEVCPKELG